MSYSTRTEATSPEALASMIAHEYDWRCPMTVTVKGEEEPCERHATTVCAYEFEGLWFTTPMCTYHANRAGKGNGIPIARVLRAYGGVA